MTTCFYPRLNAVLTTLCIAFCCSLYGAAGGTQEFDIPADTADKSLKLFSQQAGLEVFYQSDVTDGVRTKAIKGQMVARAALDALLAGTVLQVVQDEKTGAFSIRRVGDPKGQRAALPTTSDRPSESTGAKTGLLEGRIFNESTGTYLGKVRVTTNVENREQFTDSFGAYSFPAIRAGEVRVTVSYTGLPPLERTVTVRPNEKVELNFTFGEKGPDDTVTLAAFNVAASRQMAASTLAINEQRFSQSIKTVVAADSFGDISDGNVGEFVKFIPGVTLGFTGGQASSISIGGMPPASTPIMIDGNRMASAAGETRAIQLDQISLNNMARVEVERTQNADSPADAIGGSVNLVAKSAFERRKASYTVKAYSQFRDKAFTDKTYRMSPSYELGAVVPVSQRFGFAINGTSSLSDSAQYISNQAWVPSTLAPTGNFPSTTFSQPYLARYQFGDAPKSVTRQSLGFSADYRLSEYDVISVSQQYGYFFENLDGAPRDQIVIATNSVASFGPNFTQGATGTGTLQLPYSTRAVQGTTSMPSARWRHTGPTWKMEVNAAFSRSSYHDRSLSKGFFGPLNAYVRNLTVRFDDPAYLKPGKFSLTDLAGQPVDPANISNYRLETGGSNEVDRYDAVRSLNLFAQRDLELVVPVRIKFGADARSQNRDIRTPTTTFTFIGADGLVGTADDSVAQWLDKSYLDRSEPWGLPKRAGFSSRAVFETYRAHPEYFRVTETDQVNTFRTMVTASKNITETIYAPYFRLDLRHLMKERLQASAGLRYEQTEDEGVGPSINPSRIYQRDSSGNIVRNAAGSPVVMAPLTSLAGTALAYVDRGARVNRSYGQLFPSANLSYHFLSNLLGRVAFARSIARPEFSMILPSISIPDQTSLTSKTITVSNPALRPWLSNSYSASLEYYFGEQAPGALTARAYRRDISDFWSAVTEPVSNELLTTYGLDPNIYGANLGYVASTRENIGDARITGLEFDYRQSLAFLPSWGKGFSLFGNVTLQHLQGPTTADFTSFVQKTINYGLSFTHQRFTGRISANERGRERRAIFTGVGTEPGTYNYLAPWRKVDLSAEYQITRAIMIYASVRNIFNTPEDQQRYGPNTPGFARLQIRTDYRPFCGFGLKGTF